MSKHLSKLEHGKDILNKVKYHKKKKMVNVMSPKLKMFAFQK